MKCPACLGYGFARIVYPGDRDPCGGIKSTTIRNPRTGRDEPNVPEIVFGFPCPKCGRRKPDR